MHHYSVIYCYDDNTSLDDYMYQYYDENTLKSKQETMIYPIALYTCLWSVGLGIFAYKYCKINNKVNSFVYNIDKCVNYIYPTETLTQKIMNKIGTFDEDKLNNSNKLDYDLNVTESDEEYLKNDNMLNENNMRLLPPTPVKNKNTVKKDMILDNILSDIIESKLKHMKNNENNPNNYNLTDAEHLDYDILSI
jgi:hypothetical protein